MKEIQSLEDIVVPPLVMRIYPFHDDTRVLKASMVVPVLTLKEIQSLEDIVVPPLVMRMYPFHGDTRVLKASMTVPVMKRICPFRDGTRVIAMKFRRRAMIYQCDIPARFCNFPIYPCAYLNV